jgi:hypothetical protein
VNEHDVLHPGHCARLCHDSLPNAQHHADVRQESEVAAFDGKATQTQRARLCNFGSADGGGGLRSVA